MVGINLNLLGNGVVVCSVTGDIQLTIAIDQRQVTITIKTTGMTGTQRDHVTMIDIVDRGSSITIYRHSIGTCRH